MGERRPLATGEVGLPPREGGVGARPLANPKRLMRAWPPVRVAHTALIGREPASG